MFLFLLLLDFSLEQANSATFWGYFRPCQNFSHPPVLLECDQLLLFFYLSHIQAALAAVFRTVWTDCFLREITLSFFIRSARCASVPEKAVKIIL